MPIEQWGHLLAAWRSKRRRELEGPALICSLLANINRDPKQRREAFTVEDFLPPDLSAQPEEPKETDWDQVQRNMQAFIDKQNGLL